MKKLILGIALGALCATALGVSAKGTWYKMSELKIRSENGSSLGLAIKMYDEDTHVVCYSVIGISTSISCVKI